MIENGQALTRYTSIISRHIWRVFVRYCSPLSLKAHLHRVDHQYGKGNLNKKFPYKSTFEVIENGQGVTRYTSLISRHIWRDFVRYCSVLFFKAHLHPSEHYYSKGKLNKTIYYKSTFDVIEKSQALTRYTSIISRHIWRVFVRYCSPLSLKAHLHRFDHKYGKGTSIKNFIISQLLKWSRTVKV